jgi:hypothetical protein
MNSKPISFLKKLNDFVFIAAIVTLMITQALLRRFSVLKGDTSVWFDFAFNLLLSLSLFAFYLKKYNPDRIRRLFMAIFLIELVTGITMKKFQMSYSNEIVFIGFIGILFTWLNTHLNKKKFVRED